MLFRHQRSLGDVIEVEAAPLDIRAERFERLRPAAPPRVPRGHRLVHGSEGNDGRAEVALPAGRWRVEWRHDLDPRAPATALLASAGRVAVRCRDLLLLDGAGALLARWPLGAGPVALDPERRLILSFAPGGSALAASLDDGRPAFRVAPALASTHGHALLVRHDRALLLVGAQQGRDPHGHAPPPTASHAERLVLDDPPLVDGLGNVSHLEAHELLHVDRQPLLAAMSNDRLVLALPGHLVRLTPRLEVEAVLRDDSVVPVALSLDEAGRAYAVVAHTEEGRGALWVIRPDGGCVAATPLPGDLRAGLLPPLVGWDHRVFLVGSERIVAVAPEGGLLWERVPAGPVGGALVTTDGRLLVAEGDRIMLYDQARDERLFQAPGEVLCAGPVLTPEGRLLVATRERVYALSAGG